MHKKDGLNGDGKKRAGERASEREGLFDLCTSAWVDAALSFPD